jgi:hypothetical protein
MKIAIIGGGWVGCHLANKLKGEHEIKIYEKNDYLFFETSFNNQNRLHLGFHYARNYNSRELCKNTFNRFLFDYEFLTSNIEKNIYCAPSKKSLIDFKTYEIIFSEHSFKKFENINEKIDNCINTEERFIDFKKAFSFFNESLGSIHIKENVTKNKLKKLSKDFDLVINCTNNFLKDNIVKNFFYELTLTLIYEKIDTTSFDALTLVDGKLFSIFPYSNNNLYSLTDVELTPLKKFKSVDSLTKFKSKIDLEFINKKTLLFEEKVLSLFPDFLKSFKYYNYFLSVKSKINDSSDNREPVISKNKNKNIINCFTGKIQGVYLIEDYIRNEINNR